MSYTPDIIFDLNDLDKHYSKLENEYWDAQAEKTHGRKLKISEKKARRWDCLKTVTRLLNERPKQIKFKDVEFIILEVEGSQSNKAMRDFLTELEVPFTVNY